MWKNCHLACVFRFFVVPLYPILNKALDITQEIKAPIAQDFQLFEEAFAAALEPGDNPLLQQVLHYVMEKRGKQLRPILVLLAAQLCHGTNEKSIQTAVALELMHTASLIHDDVVDDSPMRRGSASVHARWNNKVAVLVGDFLLAKVIEITANLRNLKILNVVADMGHTLSSGELLQLHADQSPWITEENYYRVIEQKTASLFAACTEAGAASSGGTMHQQTALRNFGKELGIIFQIKDDVLDYSELEIGKPTLADIRDGKATLPLIIALQRAPKSEAEAIRNIASSEDIDVEAIYSFVLKYDGIGYACKRMEHHKQKALEALEAFHPSPARTALVRLLQYTIVRNY